MAAFTKVAAASSPAGSAPGSCCTRTTKPAPRGNRPPGGPPSGAPPLVARIAAFGAANPRGKHGTIDYELEPLGLDLADLRARTAFYSERFGPTPEQRRP